MYLGGVRILVTINDPFNAAQIVIFYPLYFIISRLSVRETMGMFKDAYLLHYKLCQSAEYLEDEVLYKF